MVQENRSETAGGASFFQILSVKCKEKRDPGANALPRRLSAGAERGIVTLLLFNMELYLY